MDDWDDPEDDDFDDTFGAFDELPCPHCGVDIPDDVVQCPMCGRDLPLETGQSGHVNSSCCLIYVFALFISIGALMLS